MPGVLLDEVLPFGGKIVIGEDGLHWAFLPAKVTVNAVTLIDVKLLGRLDCWKDRSM